MNILFICKYNAFRSRIAEKYFKKINKNKNVQAISRGLIMSDGADEEEIELGQSLLGINISERKPIQLNLSELLNADRIIVVADDVPKIIFNYKPVSLARKITIWKIKDEQKKNKKNIKKIILAIKSKVDKLNKELNKK